MSKYVICCPNCGSCDLEQIDYNEFECKCGEEFDIERAEVEEL
ncbi:uncharacterized protein CBO05P1_025 [Clostridium botulinum B str. Osaka05]|uniref:Uncharacterized protein n=1 Tax=Clostridium botulinum B str. Osaka05 TaxID=1407017 RepID=A0A060N9C2_CLOBO|nr:hypothetical protein [Clostridium botulinum]BAO04744.1 uncharacterized protein CBO05P1_025 [Clostridium botulinum B str. Osaka05]